MSREARRFTRNWENRYDSGLLDIWDGRIYVLMAELLPLGR